MAINKSKAKKRIEALRKEIDFHNNRYYRENDPAISDFEYDVLLQELNHIEQLFPEFITPNSPTQKVGSDLSLQPNKEFDQLEHRYQMLSLGNTYEIGELRAFDERIKKLTHIPYTYSCELKFDGTAISILYKNGRLYAAITRGDGHIGDVVTDNVLTIKSIPQTLLKYALDDFEVRGEIYMPFGAFEELNIKRIEEGEQAFANPRNAASGSLKQLDSKVVEERNLECVLYQILSDNLPYHSHTESLKAIQEWGLPISEHSKVCKDIDEVIAYIEYWDTARKSLPFPTDGVVVKVDNLDIRESIGYTSKSPRWATAYKFAAERVLTKLTSIDYQVGRTGAITPVANLDPVLLAGTTVKRASLHNEDQMAQLDIRINDYVYVEKGGEIIPKIVGIELSQRDSKQVEKPEFPTQCPDCNALLIKDKDEAKHYCSNKACPTQIKGRFLHFISRKAMNIIAGDATINQLYDKKYISTLSDLYKLDKDTLLTLDGWKEKSAERLLESIENSKSTPFHKVLFALGIRHIGETTAKLMAKQFKNIDNIINATREELIEVDEIGEIMADSIMGYFKEDTNIQLINDLKNYGIIFEAEKDEHTSDILSGLTFVISGNFSIPRDAMKALITSNGGKNTSSISSKTDYLVAGEKSGPEKLNKATKNNVKIISEFELKQLIIRANE